MNATDPRNVDPTQEMYRIAENFLDLALWGFRESFRSKKSGDLIYDSEWCRLILVWGGWDYLGGNSISIYYGRLHAPNEKSTMIWNKEECHCWHRVEHALHFLDGRMPAEAVKLDFSHTLIDPFYEPDFRKNFYRRQPEWLAKMHATVWEHYGTKLFELFDLRQSELWGRYRQFLKEFYDIKGRPPFINPSMDKVC